MDLVELVMLFDAVMKNMVVKKKHDNVDIKMIDAVVNAMTINVRGMLIIETKRIKRLEPKFFYSMFCWFIFV